MAEGIELEKRFLSARKIDKSMAMQGYAQQATN
jgi:hypothetical protein